MPHARLLRALRLITLSLLLPGCTLVQLREETNTFYGMTVLVGRVLPPAGWQGPVVVAAVTQREGRPTVVHQVRLHEPGGYELIVPDGRYTLEAWGDRDGNGRPDDADPALSQENAFEVSGQGIVLQLDITLAAGQAAAVRRALPDHPPAPPRHSTQVGALADLDAPAFSAEAGRQGYWAPLDSFQRTGGNVYFIEPYDPARTPVLFVHGAVGSAQDWRPLIAQLDRRRYQAWIFQYPSGAPLDSMANLLYWKLLNLQARYRFAQLHIVAHSMGGLVVRRLLLDHAQDFAGRLGVFVTLSTPWGGEDSAALGVRHSPAVVPSWRDMQPGQAFLTALFARPLPAAVPHMLLFGHRGGHTLMGANTDGTVTLASQLLPQAQAEARLVMGFDEDHDSILAAPQVIVQVHKLLASQPPGSGPGGAPLVLNLHRPDGGAAPAGALAYLLLAPADRPAAERLAEALMLPLTLAADGSARVGAVPPGRYEASVMLPGYRVLPARQPLRIEPGTRPAPLALSLQPQGALNGYVGAEGDALARPAGSFRAPHAGLTIRRIALQGPGGPRILVPRHDGPPRVIDAFLDGRDDAVGALFSFVDLAEGDYTLTIEADGHAPHVSRHHVQPGQGSALAPVLLRPRR